MIDDLQVLSEDYISENRDLSRRGYEGSPMRASPVTGLPDQAPGVPYTQSQTSRRSDRSDGLMMNPQDHGGERFLQHSPYSSSATGPTGYTTTTAGYPPASNYPPSQQIPAYPSSQGYPPATGYPASSNYPPGSGYPSGSSYPASSGYSAAGYPAPVGRPGIIDPNYTYDTPEYSSPNYQYGRTPNSYAGAPRPGDPRVDPRLDPRSTSAYPYVTSAQDPSIRGVATDPRYDSYGQPITSSQANRGGFPAPPRGTPTGVYDPPQPMDGGFRPERGDRPRR